MLLPALPNLVSNRCHRSAARWEPSSAVALVFICLASLCCFVGTAVAQGERFNHRGLHINPEVQHDTSTALKDMSPAPRQLGQFIHELMAVPRPPRGRFAPLDPVLQSVAPRALAPAAVNNFDGVGNGFSSPSGTYAVNAAPPDTNGSVGPNHYVQIVNTDFAVFSKSGTVIYGPVPINTLWSGFGGACQNNNDGDPIVVYDRIADRWIISQFSVSTTPYLQCIAVSQTGDPTGAYYRYSFSYGNTDFPDYPKMGVWPDAYYETFNFFAGLSFAGGEVCAFDRSQMLLGQAATQQCFNVGVNYGGLLPADLDGANLPPSGSPNYVVSLGISNNDLAFWKFHVDWTTPSNTKLTGPTPLTVAAYQEACSGRTCIPQGGTSQRLDSLADRLMYRLAYRNLGSYESLVTDHSIVAGSSVGVRWYEIRLLGGTPTVYQQGTYAPDSSYRWMGSIAMDQSGNMALGFSTSSSSLHPEIHYTGRLAGDPLGQMTQGETVIIAGSGSQSGLSRWGDYSSMAVDPSDDCTFWYTTEYIPSTGAFNWKTRIASFQFPGCGPQGEFSIASTPTSLSIQQGHGSSSSISTAVTSGSAGTVNLSASVNPAGPSVSLTPTVVTAGGSSTLSVNVGSTMAPGTYTVTVTGVEGSATHNTTVNLTVTAAPNDFSISASPGSLSINQGSSGSSTISTALTSGVASTVNLSASVSPAGPTATLNPASVTAGNSSALNVNVGTGVPPGTYTVTVTGLEGLATHSTNATVTVTAPQQNPIVNPGFEAGNFNGWTTSGATSLTSAGHTGSYAAMVGSTSPTNGDSSVSQTFIVPSSATILSFWYKTVCTDTVTYDWATATLHDNTSGSTITLLPRTCTNNGAWVQVNYNISSQRGHSVTITLTNHDDNFPFDPTYTLYDDTGVQ